MSEELALGDISKNIEELTTQVKRIADFLEKIDIHDNCICTFECNTHV